MGVWLELNPHATLEENKMEQIKNFFKDETGMETVEWAVVAALVILGVALAFRTLGNTVNSKITSLNSNITGP
jgi:Flp pilus assembly pilin Flp